MSDEELVETNVYRVLKPCSNCPFTDNGEAMHLRDGRVDEIKAMLLEDKGNSFNCHKTVYNLEKDMSPYDGGKHPLKMCAGAYNFLKKEDKPNDIMQIAERLGIEDGEK